MPTDAASRTISALDALLGGETNESAEEKAATDGAREERKNAGGSRVPGRSDGSAGRGGGGSEDDVPSLVQRARELRRSLSSSTAEEGEEGGGAPMQKAPGARGWPWADGGGDANAKDTREAPTRAPAEYVSEYDPEFDPLGLGPRWDVPWSWPTLLVALCFVEVGVPSENETRRERRVEPRTGWCLGGGDVARFRRFSPLCRPRPGVASLRSGELLLGWSVSPCHRVH